jgi:hypothetical protein
MIAANDLKVRGLKAIEEEMEHFDEVGITVRGKVKYVVMKVEKFDELREYELDKALAESRKDLLHLWNSIFFGLTNNCKLWLK